MIHSLARNLRALVITVAFARAASLSAATPPTETYPLQHYLTDLAEQEWKERASELARVRTADDVRNRIAFIRAEFLRAIGGLPTEKTPLNARVTGTLQRDGYRIEKVIYESFPGSHVTANLYVPTTGTGPFPAVLGAAGHAMAEGKALPVYQSAFIALAMRGYVVLAYDPPAQGERWELTDPATGEMKSLGHISPGLQCLLTGDTSARYFMWDGIRGLDYLLTRPEVDPQRIAAAGNSGGGTQSAFLGICEPRLAAIASSCYWTSWEALWRAGGPQDSEQVLPDWIRNGLDFSDLALAFAPKPILMLTATKDAFPVAGARVMHAEAKPFFALLGAEKQIGYFEYNDGHAWSKPRREATTAWFDEWLRGRTDFETEPAHTPEALAALRCTDTGQVVTAFGSRTTQQLNQVRAEERHAQRTLAKPTRSAEARAVIARRLALPADRSPPLSSSPSRAEGKTFSAELFALTTEPGIELAVQVVMPAGTGAGRPGVILLKESPGTVDPETDTDVAAWLRAGYEVIVAPLRGLVAVSDTKPYYTIHYKTAMRAVLLGKSMAGMRVHDALAVYDFARTQRGLDAARITMVGRGNMGVIALYAAALEPRLAQVVAESSVLSYLDLVRAPQVREYFADIIIPGVLQDFDLPDLARQAGGQRVLLVNPVTVDGRAATAESARAAYGRDARVAVGDKPLPALLTGWRSGTQE